MQKLKKTALKLWADESGQGTAEYVLILVGIVALGIAFKDKLIPIISSKLGQIGSEIQGFNPR